MAAAAEEEWAPADGVERTLYTSLATTVIGVGFALALLGAMVLAGVRIDARTGLAFGVAGFIAVALAPALGPAAGNPGKRSGGARRAAGSGGSSPSRRRRSGWRACCSRGTSRCRSAASC